MKGSGAAAAAVFVVSVRSPTWPLRMAAASRVLFAVSTRVDGGTAAVAGVPEPTADRGVTLPLSAGVGRTGAAARGTITPSDAGADATAAAARTGCLPASAAFGSQVLLR